MHIFIDESGSFASADPEKQPWNVVVAYALSDKKLEALNLLVLDLKNNLGLGTDQEIKISSFKEENYDLYLKFINNLAELNGVLFSSIINTSITDLEFHKDILEFDKEKIEDFHFKKNSHLQLYLQSRIQFDLISASIIGSKCYFSKVDPIELSNIIWKVDKKGKLFEGFHIKYINGYLSGEGHNYTYKFINETQHNFDYFYKSYSLVHEGVTGFSVTRVLNDFSFVNSEESVGVQVADLLASGIRRCFKGVWDDHENKISQAIGRLMITQPKILQISGNNPIANENPKELFPITKCGIQKKYLNHVTLNCFKEYSRNFENI